MNKMIKSTLIAIHIELIGTGIFLRWLAVANPNSFSFDSLVVVIMLTLAIVVTVWFGTRKND
jgi:hypothetical protein